MVKNPPANVGNVSLMIGSRRSPAEGNRNALQYSLLGNSIDRGTGWATVHSVVEELDMT